MRVADAGRIDGDGLCAREECRVEGGLCRQFATQQDQVELARMLFGNEGIHRIALVRKGPGFAPGEREEWLDAFSKAFVERDGERVVVQQTFLDYDSDGNR
jgi:hypothetical protein